MSETRATLPAILLSLLVALLLQILPLPGTAAAARPDWVLLVLLFWCLTRPDQVGLTTAFALGLLLDTLNGSLLGQHALALLLVTFIALKFRLRIRLYPMLQMTLVVLALLMLYQFMLFWIDGVSGRGIPLAQRLQPLLPGALMWPIVFWLLSRGGERRPDEAAAL